MITEFIDFVYDILPSVNPEIRDSAKNAFVQFQKDGHQLKYITSTPLQNMSQGDIISQIPFTYFQENGEQKIFVTDAMVLSTSCHIDNKEQIILSPLFPMSEIVEKSKNTIPELKANKIFSLLHIPDTAIEDKFIDFGIMNTYDKNLILKRMKLGKSKRLFSLNQLGYYFFITKLAVYFMRPEDKETLKERK